MAEESTEVRTRDEAAPAEFTRSERHYTPAVDIYETPESLVILVEMPGVAKEGVDVDLDKGVLTVFGKARARQLDEGYRLVSGEYYPGHFQRSFRLGEQIDKEKIVASMNRGVLRLVLPKSAAARSRKIEVKGD
jgi:HSP20 family protein